MRMARDQERIHRIQGALEKAHWDALVCARPANVLLLSGYWPVIGASIAITTREGKIGLVIPEDECELAAKYSIDEMEAFSSGSLQEIATAAQTARPALARLG